MLGCPYPTKKKLKESVGKSLRYIETSFRPEYKETGVLTVVGPDPFQNRKWYANVTMKDGIIIKVV